MASSAIAAAVTLIVAVVAAVTAPLSVAQETGFADLDANPHEAAIEAVNAEGLLAGTGCARGEGLFCPDEPIMRWEMAVWLDRALSGASDPTSAGTRFADVDAAAWWAGHVEGIAGAGVTLGCTAEPARYCPYDPVSRAQMASFLVRAFLLPPAVVPVGFTDTAGTAHEADINSLAAARISIGCSAEPVRFCPRRPVTRAQMSELLARALGLVPLPASIQTDAARLQQAAMAITRALEDFVQGITAWEDIAVPELAGIIAISESGTPLEGTRIELEPGSLRVIDETAGAILTVTPPGGTQQQFLAVFELRHGVWLFANLTYLA